MIYRYIDRQIGRQTDRQTDRQIDRQMKGLIRDNRTLKEDKVSTSVSLGADINMKRVQGLADTRSSHAY